MTPPERKASELLRGLDAMPSPLPTERALAAWLDADPLRYRSDFYSEMSPVAEWWDYYIDFGDELATLRNALPEIIAVVEAAERIDSSASGRRHGFLNLNNTLEALQAKLAGEGR